MKRLSILFMIVIAVLLTSCAKPKQTDKTIIPALDQPIPSKGNTIRRQAVQEAALSTGAQAGLSWRSQQINRMLMDEKTSLNEVFNFNALILKNNVLPPVLTEGDMALNLDGPRAIRLSDKVYRIEQPPRFVTTAPTWREYLEMNYKMPERPSEAMLPKTPEERDVWNRYVKIGWAAGVKQANQIFAINLGRLKRDYQGMVLYRKLLAQNMVTPPYVAKVDLGITGDENNMRINDQVLRITSVSKLNQNSKEWRSVVAKGQYDEMKDTPDSTEGQQQ